MAKEQTPALAGLTSEQLHECLALGATLGEIKDLAESGFGYEAIASMASLLVKNRSGGGGQAEMLAILKQQAENQSVQNERTRPRENANYVAQSIFLQPNGEPWAKTLKCEMYFGPTLLNRTPLTKEEVDALNLLQPVVKALVRKVDNSQVRVTVRPREDAIGRLESLTIEAPMKKDDNPQHYPPIVDFARQLAQAAQMAAVA
jgi:hypothetical protein